MKKYFHYHYLVQVKKNIRAIQGQLPVTYISMFQKLTCKVLL